MSDTDTIKGLTQEQVDKLTADGLFNETVKSQSKSVCQIVAGNVFTLFQLNICNICMFVNSGKVIY